MFCSPPYFLPVRTNNYFEHYYIEHTGSSFIPSHILHNDRAIPVDSGHSISINSSISPGRIHDSVCIILSTRPIKPFIMSSATTVVDHAVAGSNSPFTLGEQSLSQPVHAINGVSTIAPPVDIVDNVHVSSASSASSSSSTSTNSSDSDSEFDTHFTSDPPSNTVHVYSQHINNMCPSQVPSSSLTPVQLPDHIRPLLPGVRPTACDMSAAELPYIDNMSFCTWNPRSLFSPYNRDKPRPPYTPLQFFHSILSAHDVVVLPEIRSSNARLAIYLTFFLLRMFIISTMAHIIPLASALVCPTGFSIFLVRLGYLL